VRRSQRCALGVRAPDWSVVPTDFVTLGVPPVLVDVLDAHGIRQPYPIQAATLPDTLTGKDLFGQSPTGSGKTLAFAIPLVARIPRGKHRRPRALVLAPTRELAAQIAEVVQPLARAAGHRVATFYGGVGYRDQLKALKQSVDIVVGCPGRLVDLLDKGLLSLRDVEVVVIDEADRMADMGFLPPVRQLLRTVQGRPQTILFSATVSREVERLAAEFQHEPIRHLLERTVHDVGTRSHEFWRVARADRLATTAGLVGSLGSSIVFCRTKHGADRLARQLAVEGIAAVAIHGDRSQAQRDRALARFRERRAQVLVGTDVASRGIHVDSVDCVVHFDPPEDDDTYVHRSGRTGRAGETGRVVSLICPDQERGTRQLQRRLGYEQGFSQAPQFRPRSRQAAVEDGPSERRDQQPKKKLRRPSTQPGSAAIRNRQGQGQGQGQGQRPHRSGSGKPGAAARRGRSRSAGAPRRRSRAR
jgi:superfamily II DNA/RNA helicase